MLRFGETKLAKEKFYGAKKPIKSYIVNADSKAISKLSDFDNRYIKAKLKTYGDKFSATFVA